MSNEQRRQHLTPVPTEKAAREPVLTFRTVIDKVELVYQSDRITALLYRDPIELRQLYINWLSEGGKPMGRVCVTLMVDDPESESNLTFWVESCESVWAETVVLWSFAGPAADNSGRRVDLTFANDDVVLVSVTSRNVVDHKVTKCS
jgi:hypothetical protein